MDPILLSFRLYTTLRLHLLQTQRAGTWSLLNPQPEPQACVSYQPSHLSQPLRKVRVPWSWPRRWLSLLSTHDHSTSGRMAMMTEKWVFSFQWNQLPLSNYYTKAYSLNRKYIVPIHKLMGVGWKLVKEGLGRGRLTLISHIGCSASQEAPRPQVSQGRWSSSASYTILFHKQHFWALSMYQVLCWVPEVPGWLAPPWPSKVFRSTKKVNGIFFLNKEEILRNCCLKKLTVVDLVDCCVPY